MFVGVSVDGFLARPDGSLDFLPADGGDAKAYERFISGVDAVVMGRATFEVARGFDAWPHAGRPVVVLTTRPLDRTGWPAGAVEAMSGPPDRIVATLAGRGLTRLYVDGGRTVQAFLRAGLVDRLVITRVPVLIGQGIALFGNLPADVRLRHVDTRAYAGGLVTTEYAVVRAPL